nr:MAG TPA: NICKEL-COBALT-CADMIUM RESISTANCE PROTEIN NCCX BINDING PROTEIN, MEMBRANE PROTEIN [Caudoviricetes sp.]
MRTKLWNNIEIILITLSILIAMFTVGLMVGVYISSENIEKMSTENIRQYQTIQQQKERIRELQNMKQLKEIYG